MENEKLITQIYTDIKGRILKGDLKEDTKISERYLCDLYETSRTTVRGAVNNLKNDGWLYVRPKSGTFVAPVDMKAIKDNFQLRQLLEPQLILLAIPHITEEDIARMKKNCVCMEHGNPEDYGYCEADNHNVIKERTENKVIVRVIDEMMDNILRITSKSMLKESRQSKSVKEWTRIIECIERGDGYAASQYMLQHIINASDAFWEKYNESKS